LTDDHLAAFDHVHTLNPLQSGSGRAKGIETQHRSDMASNRSMILFDQIIQELDLASLDLLTGLSLERSDGCDVGAAFVDRDLFRQALLRNPLLQEAQRLFSRDELSAGSR
jgi:hypothetical protein